MDSKDAERLAGKTVELIEAMALKALQFPPDQRGWFVTRHIARLRGMMEFPDSFLDMLDESVRTRIAQVEAAGGSQIGTA
jgi:hypothetical protein